MVYNNSLRIHVMAKNNILVIGCGSKIAQGLIARAKDSYEIYGTYFNGKPDGVPESNLFKVDLANPAQLQQFIADIQDIPFKAILFFASTYKADSDSIEDYMHNFERDLRVNALHQILIAKHATYAEKAKVLLFGDAGLYQPKKGFTSYSVSKSLLQTLSRILAAELIETATVITFALGPTKPPKAWEQSEKAYFTRNPVQVADPAGGLVNYIMFLIEEENLSTTGIEIPYDGGAYLLRNKSQSAS